MASSWTPLGPPSPAGACPRPNTARPSARPLTGRAEPLDPDALDRRVLGDEGAAWDANQAFEQHYAAAVRAGEVAALPGAVQVMATLRAAGVKVCLLTGFSPVTRDALLDALDWRPLIDLALSPADAGRGRPWPDLPLTALLRLGGGAVSELATIGDTPSDIESGLRPGAGIVAGVLTGTTSRDEFTQAGATHILDTVAGLPALLGL